MVDIWLFPILIVLALVVGAFYLLIRFKGGSGVRTEGRTLVHKPSEEDNSLPPLD